MSYMTQKIMSVTEVKCYDFLPTSNDSKKHCECVTTIMYITCYTLHVLSLAHEIIHARKMCVV